MIHNCKYYLMKHYQIQFNISHPNRSNFKNYLNTILINLIIEPNFYKVQIQYLKFLKSPILSYNIGTN